VIVTTMEYNFVRLLAYWTIIFGCMVRRCYYTRTYPIKFFPYRIRSVSVPESVIWYIRPRIRNRSLSAPVRIPWKNMV